MNKEVIAQTKNYIKTCFVLTILLGYSLSSLGQVAEFQLKSQAFSAGGVIPKTYTCDGSDISPPLSWSSPPQPATSYAIILEDPDAPAGTWIHWIVFNIPASIQELKANTLPKTAQVGQNSWGRREYGGPCPPTGTHHYVFKLYAFDRLIDPATVLSPVDLTKSPHLIAQTQLIGLYTHT